MKKLLSYAYFTLIPITILHSSHANDDYFDDLPTEIICEISKHLEYADHLSLYHVSKRFHDIFENEIIVAHHYPQPMFEWLSGKYSYAVKRMLSNKPSVKFYPNYESDKLNLFSGTNWDGSVMIGVSQNFGSDKLNTCIYTLEEDLNFSEADQGIRNSRTCTMDQKGRFIGGDMRFDHLISHEQLKKVTLNDGNLYKGSLINISCTPQVAITQTKGNQLQLDHIESLRTGIINWNASVTLELHNITEFDKKAFMIKTNGTNQFIPPTYHNLNAIHAVNWDGSLIIGSLNYGETYVARHQRAFLYEKNSIMRFVKLLNNTYVSSNITVSQDGAIIVGQVHHNDNHKSSKLVLHNRILNKTLSLETLFDNLLNHLPRSAKIGIDHRKPIRMNFLGNIIIGTGWDKVTHHDIGWQIFIPRYDILDREGIPYTEPEWITEF